MVVVVVIVVEVEVGLVGELGGSSFSFDMVVGMGMMSKMGRKKNDSVV